MPTGVLRVAAVQAEAVPGDVAGNLAAAVRWIERAADDGAELVVFPEAFTTGYDEAVFAGALPGADLAWCAPAQAAVERAGIVAVLSTPLDDGHRRTLSSVVLRPGQAPASAYDKMHLDGPERELFVAGESHAGISVGDVAVGLSICADTGFAAHAVGAAQAGAEVYVNSGAWFSGGEQRRDATHAARARESGLPLVFAGLVSVSPGATPAFIGGSAVFDADGRLLTQAPPGVEALVVATLAPRARRPDERAAARVVA